MENKQTVSSNPKAALIYAILVGFAFSANYTNHAPLKDWLMKSFDSVEHPFTKTMFGFLTTAIFLTHAIMQIPGGLLADKFGPKKVVTIALSIVCIGNFGIAFASSYEQLLLWKFLVGFGTGTCFVAGARYIFQSTPTNKLLLYQGYYGASVLLGSGFVIFAIPQIAGYFQSWSAAFLASATVAVLVLLAWIFLAPAAGTKEHPHGSLLKMLSHGELWLMGLVQMASFGLVIVIGSWITTLLKENFSFSSKLIISFIASLVLLLGLVSRPLGGKMIVWIGVRKLLLGSLLINAAGCFLLAYFPQQLGLDILAILLLGMGCGLPYAGVFNRAAHLFPGRAGAAMGLVNMLGIVFILVGTPIVGKIADGAGNFSNAFLALGIFATLIAVVSLKIKTD